MGLASIQLGKHKVMQWLASIELGKYVQLRNGLASRQLGKYTVRQ
jgi:hypothetical protein